MQARFVLSLSLNLICLLAYADFPGIKGEMRDFRMMSETVCCVLWAVLNLLVEENHKEWMFTGDRNAAGVEVSFFL